MFLQRGTSESCKSVGSLEWARQNIVWPFFKISMKTFIGINTLTAVEQIVYSNHIGFFYRLGKHYPNDTFALYTPRRTGIDRMRNAAAKIAIENNYDYLMFIDDDVVVPLDMFDKLVAVQKDIIAGWTVIRGYPFDNMFFKFDDKHNLVNVKDVERKSGILDVDAIGFSTALIKVDLLKQIPPPWFVTGPTNTEDIYFCLKARKHVPECTICVDTSIETAHILGPEFISPWNKKDYATYFRAQNPEIVEPPLNNFIDKSGDRGASYLEMAKGTMETREKT